MEYIECGKIVGTHGIKGEVKIEPWCDSPDFLMEFEELFLKDGGKMKVKSTRAHKGNILAVFEGISDLNAAAALIGTVVYLDRDDIELPDGAYFISDLIGTKVYNAVSGEYYGAIKQVLQNGAKDVYIVENNGKELLFPAIPEIIKSFDKENKKMDIIPLEGLFD